MASILISIVKQTPFERNENRASESLAVSISPKCAKRRKSRYSPRIAVILSASSSLLEIRTVVLAMELQISATGVRQLSFRIPRRADNAGSTWLPDVVS